MRACENKRPTSVIPQELTLLAQGLLRSETGRFSLAGWTSSCLLLAYTATPSLSRGCSGAKLGPHAYMPRTFTN